MNNLGNTSASFQGTPLEDPNNVLMGEKCSVTCLDTEADLKVISQLPLPGIVIFVHGVNSDGEWYAASEAGLCEGLNERLKRCDEHLAHPGVVGGQMKPVKYRTELTDDGFLNPEWSDRTFIQDDEHFSPVIQFRWGYKANGEELQKFGKGLYLNEENYWGGGPFANGCTSLPDLWGDGLNDNLFLWLNVQHLNPLHDRSVYACPPRAYYVLAAYRLATLVKSIRQKQADVPITIVSHSQGNMIGMAAAFLGDRMAPVSDAIGKSGRCIADNYVLCNPPYSLVAKNITQGLAERRVKDAKGSGGRQTSVARNKTLAAFFDLIRAQKAAQQDAAAIDASMANVKHGFDAKSDRTKYGFGRTPSTHGRVTLYFNPHDQVISATTIQGIGWRGMSAEEIHATNGHDVFSQRVFAQGFKVGTQGYYDFWADHHGKGIKPGSEDFWHPRSKKAGYDVKKGSESSESFFGKVFTWTSAPLMIAVTKVAGVTVNALPPDNWQTPLTAPPLPESFEPQSYRFGKTSRSFDEAYNPPGEARDKDRVHELDDPYADSPSIPRAGATATMKNRGHALGDRNSEAALRYEHHAYLRFQAKRAGFYAADEKVKQEDEPGTATDAYKTWRNDMLRDQMAANVDAHATDHSTIMTNGMHAKNALAYDVALGRISISKEDMRKLRIAADWRLLQKLDRGDSALPFAEYIIKGRYKGLKITDWSVSSEGACPTKITDIRAIGSGAPGDA